MGSLQESRMSNTSSEEEVTTDELAAAFCALLKVYVDSKASTLASPSKPSPIKFRGVGLCTRKDEFMAKTTSIDPFIQQLTAASTSDSDRYNIATMIAKDFGVSAMECLIRYRHPEMSRVFQRLLHNVDWPVRARALYGLKMVGGQDDVDAIGRILANDKEPQVREVAASALGYIGGVDSHAILKRANENENHPYVRATIVESLQQTELGAKPYPPWSETLVGPMGARRVEWQWQVKGKHSFNNYDGTAKVLSVATTFCYPVSWYKQDLFTPYPRTSFGAGGKHAGEDCAWFREGCSLYAIADGVVRMVQGAGGDWGFLIVIEHLIANDEYLTSVYGHAAWDVLVKPGDFVKMGQKIGSQGLSTSTENGGYGSHLHFGIGYGPFRRSAKAYTGGPMNLNINGETKACKVARFGYSNTETNRFGWPRITVMLALPPDGSGRQMGTQIVMPEESLGEEVSWLRAYIPNCRGWINPERWLPDHVKGEWDTC